MAMTLDKLFNFDEQTLARQIMDQKKYKAQADADKHGWGNTVAGFSRLVDNTIGPGGALGVKDPILQEKALVETAFANAQNNLTPEELADPAILYTKMLGELQNVGAPAKYTMGLSKIIEEQKNETRTSIGNAAFKKFTAQNTLNEAEWNQEFKILQAKNKKEKEFNKYFTDIAEKGERELDGYIKKTFPNIDGGAYLSLYNQLKSEASEIYRNNNITVQQSIVKASSNMKDRFKFENAGIQFWKDDKITLKDPEKVEEDKENVITQDSETLNKLLDTYPDTRKKINP